VADTCVEFGLILFLSQLRLCDEVNNKVPEFLFGEVINCFLNPVQAEPAKVALGLNLMGK
jgi:hypothetical protein